VPVSAVLKLGGAPKMADRLPECRVSVAFGLQPAARCGVRNARTVPGHLLSFRKYERMLCRPAAGHPPPWRSAA
jgi:hypothetical protein